MYLNSVTLIGNLTKDPEMKALPTGANVTTFGLATNRKYKNKDGQYVDEPEYHNIVVFGPQAESCNKYLAKGTQVLIQGRLKTRDWEKDGVKHYRTEIVAEDVTFGRKPEASKVPGTNVDYPEPEANIPF